MAHKMLIFYKLFCDLARPASLALDGTLFSDMSQFDRTLSTFQPFLAQTDCSCYNPYCRRFQLRFYPSTRERSIKMMDAGDIAWPPRILFLMLSTPIHCCAKHKHCLLGERNRLFIKAAGPSVYARIGETTHQRGVTVSERDDWRRDDRAREKTSAASYI